jgi:hypothetical protein
VLDALLSAALLGYLAIAHHGRGRGAWVAQEPPTAWTAAVAQVLAERKAAVSALWQQREAMLTQTRLVEADVLQAPLQALLADLCARLLARLYPDAEKLPAS